MLAGYCLPGCPTVQPAWPIAGCAPPPPPPPPSSSFHLKASFVYWGHYYYAILLRNQKKGTPQLLYAFCTGEHYRVIKLASLNP
jgi:hypothetical protein